MSIANKIGLGLRSFGLGTKHIVTTTGKGVAKGFKHLGAGLKGENLDPPKNPRTVAKSKYRRARA